MEVMLILRGHIINKVRKEKRRKGKYGKEERGKRKKERITGRKEKSEKR